MSCGLSSSMTRVLVEEEKRHGDRHTEKGDNMKTHREKSHDDENQDRSDVTPRQGIPRILSNTRS